jgi:hypothetical protein
MIFLNRAKESNLPGGHIGDEESIAALSVNHYLPPDY